MAGLAAAGAAAGTAILPGVGTAIGGVAGALADSFMGGGGSASGGGGYAPQDAHSAIYGDLGLDSSGWSVNFAGKQSVGSNKAGADTAYGGADAAGYWPDMSGAANYLTGGAATRVSPLLVVGVVAIIGIAIWKKSKSSK